MKKTWIWVRYLTVRDPFGSVKAVTSIRGKAKIFVSLQHAVVPHHESLVVRHLTDPVYHKLGYGDKVAITRKMSE